MAKVTFDAAEERKVEKRRKDSYKMAYDEVAAERTALAEERTRLRTKLRELEAALIDDPGDSATLCPQLQALRETQRLLDERIAALDAHYSAWLGGRVASVDDQFELVVSLVDLPATIEEADAKFGERRFRMRRRERCGTTRAICGDVMASRCSPNGRGCAQVPIRW